MGCLGDLGVVGKTEGNGVEAESLAGMVDERGTLPPPVDILLAGLPKEISVATLLIPIGD